MILCYYIISRAISTGITLAVMHHNDMTEETAFHLFCYSLVPVLGEILLLSVIPYHLTNRWYHGRGKTTSTRVPDRD